MNPKYKAGLSKKMAHEREEAQEEKSEAYKKNPDDKSVYKKDLPGDEGEPKKKSKYAEGKGAGSLKEVAERYNAPLGALIKIYNKGLAAWASSGHRPKASQHGWARARVLSVLKGGKARKVDAKEWAQIEAYRKKSKA